MNIVRRARSECMCVRLLCSLFRCDHEQVVEKITPVVVVAVGDFSAAFFRCDNAGRGVVAYMPW